MEQFDSSEEASSRVLEQQQRNDEDKTVVSAPAVQREVSFFIGRGRVRVVSLGG